MPKVSVITPIYNVADYLPQCLQSLRSQTLEDIEFICVNDGSTDRSLDILREFASRDERFVIIDKPNAGYGHTMNTGLDAARGDYIGIVESDDFIEPCAFEKLYELAAANEFCDIVKANHYVQQSGKDPVRVENFPPRLCGRVLSPLDEEGQAVLNTIPATWAAIYRREFLQRNEIRFLETPGAAFQDTGFVFKSWIACDTFYLVHDAYLHYRIDNENSSVKSGEKALYVCDEFDSIERFLDERPERRAVLSKRIEAKKFDTYCWNYNRIDRKFRKDFLELTAAELTLALQRGELDEQLYTPDEWSRLMAIIADPDAVFAADERQAAQWSATAIREGAHRVPMHARDAFAAASRMLRRALPKPQRSTEAASKVVSIVIPVYNAEPYLDKLFDTLLAQTHEALEVICVDDSSTDGSLAKLEGYAATDPRVHVTSIHGGGAGIARNAGIEMATGDYLCFIDADDFIEEGTIAQLVDLACAHGLDVVIYGIDDYEDDTHARKKMKHAVVKGKVPDGEVFKPREIDNFFVNMTGFTVNKLYDMRYFEKLGLRFPAIGAHEDMPFTYAAVAAADRAYYLDKPLYHYRLERVGSRSESTEKQFSYMFEALECMRDELKRLGIWDECERDFANYALAMCRWKFGGLQKAARVSFYEALTDGGWLARLGVTGHESSYYYEKADRHFYHMITTLTYLGIVEDENEYLCEEFDEVLNSKTFRLGCVFAWPVQFGRRQLFGEDEDE